MPDKIRLLFLDKIFLNFGANSINGFAKMLAIKRLTSIVLFWINSSNCFGEKAIKAQQKVILTHLDYIHDYYSSFCESCNSEVKMRRNGHKYIDLGVRISRKHICRYFIQMVEWKKYRSLFDAPHTQHNTEYALKEYIKRIEIAQKQFNRLVSYKDQKSFLIKLFGYINKTGDIAA